MADAVRSWMAEPVTCGWCGESSTRALTKWVGERATCAVCREPAERWETARDAENRRTNALEAQRLRESEARAAWDRVVPAGYRECSLDSYLCPPGDARALGKVQAWLRARAKAILFVGPTGAGKSHLAYGALREIGVGHAAAWRSPELLAHLRGLVRRDEDADAAIEDVCEAWPLLLDDLGAERVTPYALEVVERIAEARAGGQAWERTILTSNLTPDGWGAAIGERAASRLLGLVGEWVVPVRAADYRLRGRA